MDQEKIGKYIKKLRTENKMTQQDLADKLSVDRRTISRWENGNYLPDISLMKELCNIFNISIDELLQTKRKIIKEKKKKSDIKIFITIIFLLINLKLATFFANNLFLIIILITLMIILILRFSKTSNIIYLALFILFLIYTSYTVLTSDGGVRSVVLLMGHPIKAYTIDYEEYKPMRHVKENFYYIGKSINTENGQAGFVKVKKYWIIKISSYYGY